MSFNLQNNKTIKELIMVSLHAFAYAQVLQPYEF